MFPRATEAESFSNLDEILQRARQSTLSTLELQNSHKTLYFDVARSTVVLLTEKGEEVLAEFKDTHEHLYYLLRCLLTKSSHTFEQLLKMYGEIESNIPSLRERLQPAPANIISLLCALEVFLLTDNGKKLGQYISITMHGVHRNRCREVQVCNELPYYVPFVLTVPETLPGNKIHKGKHGYDLEFAGVHFSFPIDQLAGAVIAILSQTAQKDEWMTAEQLIVEISKSNVLPAAHMFTVNSLIAMYRGFIMNKMLVSNMIETNFTPSMKTGIKFRLNPHYLAIDTKEALTA